jgi:hypothetical protein
VTERYYVLADGKGLFFHRWSGIGPMMTENQVEAHRFEDKRDARMAASKHFGLTMFEPLEIRHDRTRAD